MLCVLGYETPFGDSCPADDVSSHNRATPLSMFCFTRTRNSVACVLYNRVAGTVTPM